ncbi:MAG: folylpolyglutamate synthase/dihydrofolate synthase family protein [Ginsengibacter sp.]
MDYEETLQYLYDSLPMFSRTGAAAYKKDITNTAILCSFLDNPQATLKCIHVAGTNGKGSTSHMLAAVFQQAGYKTGLYTSPHLKDFRERIRINGNMISQHFVVEFVKKIKAYSEEIQPSFFELTVAMMLQYFKEHKVDIAIIETGLGGKLDSTNIIDPELSIITNISFDHTNILGNTLREIALEKAGIIKPYKPVVIGETNDEFTQIFSHSAQINQSPIYFAENEYAVMGFESIQDLLYISYSDKKSGETVAYATDLDGIYQQKNLRTVIVALDVLKDTFNISYDDVHEGLMHVKSLTGLHGRWEKIADHPLTVMDVGHNEAGIRAILQQIESMTYEKLHIVIGIVKDKDVDTILSLLPPGAKYYFTMAHIQRALPAEELQNRAAYFNLTGACYNSVNEAIITARSIADRDDLIVICGSVYLVGEVDN